MFFYKFFAPAFQRLRAWHAKETLWAEAQRLTMQVTVFGKLYRRRQVNDAALVDRKQLEFRTAYGYQLSIEAHCLRCSPAAQHVV